MVEIAEKIATEWEQLKAENAKRLEEMQKHGAVSAQTQARVDALNTSITEMQDKHAEQMRALEARLNRPYLGGSKSEITDQRMTTYAKWWAQVKGGEPDPARVELDTIAAYNRAFRDYMRHGQQGMRPENFAVLNAMSEGSDPDGGYWVSPDTSGRTVELVYETSPMRQLASQVTISTDMLEGMNDLDQAGTGGWIGETGTRSETTTPQIGMWKIEVHEQYAEPRATQRLLDDAAFDIEGWLASKVAARFARDENAAFVSGDGVGKPRGFTTYTDAAPTASAWQAIERIPSGAAAGLTYDGIVNLIFSLKSAYLNGARFGMNRLVERDLRLIVDGNGLPIWLPDFREGRVGTLMGYPITEMPDMAVTAASAIVAWFGNMREAYQIVDHSSGLQTLRDPYTAKPYVKFYTRKRVGGGVVNFEAIKLQDVAAS